MVDFNKVITNSNKFRQPAIEFQKSGKYCHAPEGTSEYNKFWEAEQEKCINGWRHKDGDFITGYNYFYLNYCPILRLVESEIPLSNGGTKKVFRRDREFPNFWDYDYYYFSGVQLAEESGKHMVVIKKRGAGYEQPYSELVATPTGFRKMGDLKLNDYVMNPDGLPTKVTEIHEHGYKDVLELTLADGRKVRCGNDHLWEVINAHNHFKVEVLTTRQMMHKGLYRTYDGYNHYRYYIPTISEVQYAEKDLEIHPYVLGALLGDGALTRRTPKLATTDDEILHRVESLLGEDYILKRDFSTCNYLITYKRRFDKEIGSQYHNGQYGVNKLARDIDAMGLKVGHLGKFIPTKYKYGSIEQRYELVRGLMDTDGHIGVSGTIEFTNTSKQLIDDLAEVLRSLGIKCSIGIDERVNKFAYRLHICTNKPIFHLTRKLKRIRPEQKRNEKVAVIDIKPLGYQERSRCITVENENHLYLTRDYIPTHNSFKNASMLCRNFSLVPNSTSIAVAAEKDFLLKDGILNKAWDMLEFIAEHTPWGKAKQKIDTQMHKRASFIVTDENGQKVEVGYKSEIIGVTIKNDPHKMRGRRAKLILFEEAGNSPHLLEAWSVTRPSVEESGNAFGTLIAFGTGGQADADFEGLKEMFYNCKGYNVQEFPNIWDEGADGTTCAFFVPEWTNMTTPPTWPKPLMDEDGNSIRENAIEYAMIKRREVLDNAKERTAVDRYVSERPMTPQEACLDLGGNIFPRSDLSQHLARLRISSKTKGYKHVGKLHLLDGKPQWEELRMGDIIKYPLGRDDDPTGSIVIWEHPPDNPPYGMYVAGADPKTLIVGVLKLSKIGENRAIL